jgi:hypothetical protein
MENSSITRIKGLINSLLNGQKILLLLLPLVYLLAGAYFRNLLGNLSLRSVDPDYIYFMSGLTLSDGVLKLGHFDNPGTPLQILIALIFKIIYLFRPTPTPYLEDVFLHPDLYLSITNILITSLTAALLWYAGRKIFQATGSVFYALLIQTAPFLPVIWYDLIGRIAPELMMPFPVVILTVLIILISKKENPISNRYLFFFSLVSAFGLSVKLTFLPIWFIPFMIMEGWKKKLLFLGISLGLFFLIAFPVTLQIDFFWSWIKNLFIHSGQYGGGESNILDINSLRSNLKELFGYERQYFYLFAGLACLFLVYLIRFRKNAEKRMVLITLAVILTVIIQVLMVGKHYAHRYFIPVLMLLPLIVYLMCELTSKLLPVRVAKLIVTVGIMAFFAWSIQIHSRWLPLKTVAMGNDIEHRLPTWHFASMLDKDSYKVITSQNYGCPFIEYTLMYSMAWACNAKKTEYAPVLGKLYPYTYVYSTWDNSLRYWGEKFDAGKIPGSGHKIYLYLERDEEDLYNKTILKLSEENGSPVNFERIPLYQNPTTKEVIYQLKVN